MFFPPAQSASFLISTLNLSGCVEGQQLEVTSDLSLVEADGKCQFSVSICKALHVLPSVPLSTQYSRSFIVHEADVQTIAGSRDATEDIFTLLA